MIEQSTFPSPSCSFHFQSWGTGTALHCGTQIYEKYNFTGKFDLFLNSMYLNNKG